VSIKKVLKKIAEIVENQNLPLSVENPVIYHESIEVLNATPSFHHLLSVFQSVMSELKVHEKELIRDYLDVIEKYVSKIFELYPDYSIVITPLARTSFDQPVSFHAFTESQKTEASRKIKEFIDRGIPPAIILIKNQDLHILEKATKSLSSLVRQRLSLKPEPVKSMHPSPGKYRVFVSQTLAEGVPLSDVVLIGIFLESFAHKPPTTQNVSFSVKVYKRVYLGPSDKQSLINESNLSNLVSHFPELEYRLKYPERQGPYLGEFVFVSKSDEDRIVSEIKTLIDIAMSKAELFLEGLDIFSNVRLEDVAGENVIYGKKIIAEVSLPTQEKSEEERERDEIAEPEDTGFIEEPQPDTSEIDEEKKSQHNLPYIQKEVFSEVVSMMARTVVREIRVGLESIPELKRIAV